MHEQNRSFRRGKDTLGDRTKKDVGKCATSFCAENDEVEPTRLCKAYDFLRYVPGADLHVVLDACGTKHFPCGLEFLVAQFAQIGCDRVDAYELLHKAKAGIIV